MYFEHHLAVNYQSKKFLDQLQSIALAFERCVLRDLAAWQKLSIFKATEHHGMKEEA